MPVCVTPVAAPGACAVLVDHGEVEQPRPAPPEREGDDRARHEEAGAVAGQQREAQGPGHEQADDGGEPVVVTPIRSLAEDHARDQADSAPRSGQNARHALGNADVHRRGHEVGAQGVGAGAGQSRAQRP